MADVSQIKLPNGSVYDLIDEKSGYITAEYIENKTDYEIPVSRVGEIVVGETAIGTDSTNFPTSKAVVDYVDERVVQEMDAIDVGVTGIKADGTSLTIENGVVNIPGVNMQTGQAGLVTSEFVDSFKNYVRSVRDSIPTSTSELDNDSGFITASDVSTNETDPTVPAWAKSSTKPTYTASEVGALPSDTVIPQIFMVAYNSSTNTADKTYTEINQAYSRGNLVLLRDSNGNIYQITNYSWGYLFTTIENLTSLTPAEGYNAKIRQLKIGSNNTWSTIDYKLPRKTSDLTNDSGYLTASDIASVMTYKGTKANYAALPSTSNTTGDVWHLTDTGAEWAWDGSAWQELGTAIDMSGYVPAISQGPEQTYIPRIKIDNVDGALTIQGQVINSGTYEVMPYYGNKIYLSKSNLLLGAISSTTNTANIRIITNDAGTSTTIIRNLVTPTTDTDATNKKYVDDSIGALSIPTKTSDLTNDSGFLTSYTETDPTVPSWAKASSKPSYSLTEISGTDDLRVIEGLTGTTGLLKKTAANTWTLDTNTYLTSYTETDPTVPSWAKQSSKPTYTASEVGAMSTSHAANGITAAKINAWDAKSDFSGSYNDLTDKPTIPTIPTNISAFTNDSGYLTSYTETDPTVPSWAKQSSKPSYGLTEISGTDDLRAIEALTGTSGLLRKTAANTWTLDTNTYLTSYTETDPTVPSWAKQSSKPTYTAAEVGALPDSTVIPSKVSDLTNDSGFITSYTDEKVKTIVDSQRTYYLTGSIKSSVEATETLIKHPSAHIYVSGDSITRGYTTLSLGNDVATSEIGGKSGKLNLYSTSSNAIILTPVTGVTADRTITLPDKDGTIALTSDIPTVPTKVSDLTNDSGFISSYTETDPVFSASAAAGITSTDISNWNGKSNTDEKLKTNLVSDTEMYYPIFGNASTIAENKQYSDSFKFQCGSNNANLTLGKQNDKQGVIQIWYGNYITYLYGNGNSTANHIVYLPARQGTLALTSDIPSVYSSTNTGGYLTMATLPIYDGTVE